MCPLDLRGGNYREENGILLRVRLTHGASFPS
jgi:hypothetical protein